MTEQYKFSQKQNLKNTGWGILRQLVFSFPPIIGAFVGLMITDYNETAALIGGGIGFAIGGIGWWFMPKSKSVMVKTEQ